MHSLRDQRRPTATRYHPGTHQAVCVLDSYHFQSDLATKTHIQDRPDTGLRSRNSSYHPSVNPWQPRRLSSESSPPSGCGHSRIRQQYRCSYRTTCQRGRYPSSWPRLGIPRPRHWQELYHRGLKLGQQHVAYFCRGSPTPCPTLIVS